MIKTLRKIRDHDQAFKAARSLAIALIKKHFPEADRVGWKPSDELPELILQIDNMTARLVQQKKLRIEEPPKWIPNKGKIWPFLDGTEIAVIWKDGTETYPQKYEVFLCDWADVAFFRITKGEWPWKPGVPVR